MPRKGHSSGSRRYQRSNDRHSSTSDRSASVPFDTASTHPSISDGWTSIASADDTAPSDISTDSGPNPPPVQPQGPVLGFDASLPPHPQAAFDGQQMDPWQGYPSQPYPYQGHYAASSPEAIGHEGYVSPGNSDDSMLASPGSPPASSPPRPQRSIPSEDNTNRNDSTEHNRKRSSHTRAPSVVTSWRSGPRDIPSIQGAFMEGYTYQQCPSPYPLVINDADVGYRDDQEQEMDNAYNNRDYRPYQAQEADEDWDRCEVDDSSCTRRR